MPHLEAAAQEENKPAGTCRERKALLFPHKHADLLSSQPPLLQPRKGASWLASAVKESLPVFSIPPGGGGGSRKRGGGSSSPFPFKLDAFLSAPVLLLQPWTLLANLNGHRVGRVGKDGSWLRGQRAILPEAEQSKGNLPPLLSSSEYHSPPPSSMLCCFYFLFHHPFLVIFLKFSFFTALGISCMKKRERDIPPSGCVAFVFSHPV